MLTGLSKACRLRSFHILVVEAAEALEGHVVSILLVFEEMLMEMLRSSIESVLFGARRVDVQVVVSEM